jgi:hypothetical protein
MKTTTDLIPDSEIEHVHANASFGSMSKRDVVDEGVLHYAFGYSTGHTMWQILSEHGLLRAARGRSAATLSVKGMHYLRAMYDLDGFTKLLEFKKNS